LRRSKCLRSRRPLEPGVQQAADSEAALALLRDAVAADGARLSVVLHPILSPLEEWTEEEVASRRRSLEMFERLGLEVFDLLPALEVGLGAAIEMRSDPSDGWHPSQKAGHLFAGYLLKRGLLEPTVGDGCRGTRGWRKARRTYRLEQRRQRAGATVGKPSRRELESR